MGKNRTVIVDRRPQVAERLPKLESTDGKPKGRYTIEFFDDLTGRRVHRESRDNYISPAWEKHVLGLQYANPWLAQEVAHSSVIYNRYASGVKMIKSRYAGRYWHPQGAVPLCTDAIFLTDWEGPEDDTSHWFKGMPIAAALRWKWNVGASGKMGQINEAECAFSNDDNTHKTVWDWSTQQGNGTFQTVGIAGCALISDTSPLYTCLIGPQTVLLGAMMKNYTGTYASECILTSNLIESGGNVYWVENSTDSTFPSNLILRSAPTASVMAATALTLDPFVQDATGATVSTVFDTGMDLQNASGGGAGIIYFANTPLVGLARDSVSGDFVFAYARANSATPDLRLRRMTPAGATVYDVQVATNAAWSYSTHTQCQCVIIGTNVYVSRSAVNNFYRCNLSDGALTATIPSPIGMRDGTEMAMAVDDSDLVYMSDWGLARCDVNGDLVGDKLYGAPFNPFSAQHSGGGLSPFYTDQGPTNRQGILGWAHTIAGTPARFGGGNDTWGFYWNNAYWGVAGSQFNVNTRSTSGSGNNTFEEQYGISNPIAKGLLDVFGATEGARNHPRGILIYNNKIWQVHPRFFNSEVQSGISGPGAALVAVNGGNCFSQTTLEEPRTKTSSQNMKVSYELTWPSGNQIDRVLPHQSI